jgi:hypothetical protein
MGCQPYGLSLASGIFRVYYLQNMITMIIYRLRIKKKQKCNEEKSRQGLPSQRAPSGGKGHGCFAEPRLGAAYGFSRCEMML